MAAALAVHAVTCLRLRVRPCEVYSARKLARGNLPTPWSRLLLKLPAACRTDPFPTSPTSRKARADPPQVPCSLMPSLARLETHKLSRVTRCIPLRLPVTPSHALLPLVMPLRPLPLLVTPRRPLPPLVTLGSGTSPRRSGFRGGSFGGRPFFFPTEWSRGTQVCSTTLGIEWFESDDGSRPCQLRRILVATEHLSSCPANDSLHLRIANLRAGDRRKKRASSIRLL